MHDFASSPPACRGRPTQKRSSCSPQAWTWIEWNYVFCHSKVKKRHLNQVATSNTVQIFSLHIRANKRFGEKTSFFLHFFGHLLSVCSSISPCDMSSAVLSLTTRSESGCEPGTPSPCRCRCRPRRCFFLRWLLLCWCFLLFPELKRDEIWTHFKMASQAALFNSIVDFPCLDLLFLLLCLSRASCILESSDSLRRRLMGKKIYDKK